MNIETIKATVTSNVSRQILKTQKNAPTILFVGGVVGVVGTAVLASRATLQLEGVLDEGEELMKKSKSIKSKDYTEEDRNRDQLIIKTNTALNIAKLYAPSIALGAVSIAALTRSHVILTRRNASLMAAYSALDKGFNEYRSRVREELGEDKDLEFRHGKEERTETFDSDDGSTKTVTSVGPHRVPSVYAKYFDDGSTSWSRNPDYNRFFLNSQQNYFNDMLRSRGHVFLNEVYDHLGLPRTKPGAIVGWVLSKDGDNFIDFGVYDHNSDRARAFVNGNEGSILLDFNVDGVIYDLLEE